MKNLISNLILGVFSLSLNMVYSITPAKPATPNPAISLLRENVVKSLVKKANDPNSLLHQKLVELNKQATDGRNLNGVFPKTLTENNIQVIFIDGEDQYGRYCHVIPEKPEHLRCENSASASYLILVPYKTQVHKATEYESLLFTVQAKKTSKWKVDNKEQEYDRHDSIQVEEPVAISIKTGGT